MVTGVPMERDVRVRRGRKGVEKHVRRPSHRFNIISKPYQIQPCGIAPVLPGETMQYALLQSQTWTDPLAANAVGAGGLAAGFLKNIGWWCEYFGFYVPHSALVGWDTDAQIGHEMGDMMISNASLAGFQDADGLNWTYCAPGGIDYLLECTKAVAGSFFRDEGEAWNISTTDGVPNAKIYTAGQSDWTDKLTLNSAYQDRTVDVPDTMGEMQDAYMEWMGLRDAGLVTMDYDDWMRAYGTPGDPIDYNAPDSPRFHRPEVAFHFRKFEYPTNTVDMATGIPTTAVGFRVAEQARKRLAFGRPGWIVWYQCVRPKVYLGNQQGAIAGFMQDRISWLPPQNTHHLDSGHIMFDDTHGPLAGVMTGSYWIDLRDLLTFGDQFCNYATPASGVSGVPFMDLPAVDANRRYADAASVMALFSDTTYGRIRTDGVLQLSIATYEKQNANQLLTLGAST